MARKYEVRLALDGTKSGVHHTGEVFPIDIPNEEVVGFKHEILSFSNAQAMQSRRRSDGNGAHFLRLSYAVTKRSVLNYIGQILFKRPYTLPTRNGQRKVKHSVVQFSEFVMVLCRPAATRGIARHALFETVGSKHQAHVQCAEGNDNIRR